MQYTFELNIDSPIVSRVLRIRERMNTQVSSLLPEEEATSFPQQEFESPFDVPHMCSGKTSFLIHAWEKLSSSS